MMQEKHIQEKIRKSYPYADIIFGTHTLHKFPENLYNALKEKKRIDLFMNSFWYSISSFISTLNSIPSK